MYRRLKSGMHPYAPSLLLASILLVALGLRLWGIGFGLPNLYHPDEDAVLIPAITIVKTGDLEPTRMEYGTLHIYVLTAVSVVVFLISARNGYITTPEQLAVFERGTYPAVYAHPEYFLAARATSALIGTAIVLLIYMLARRLGNQRQAVMAAVLAAILPALVTHAHFATPDTLLTFFSLLALILLLRAYDNWERNTMWAYAGAGFVCGLAASTKYNGVVLAFPLLLVPLLKVRQLDDLLSVRTLIGPLAMVAGFLAGTPYALLNIPKFLFWVGYSLRLYNNPGAAPALPGWRWHLNYHVTSPNAPIFFLGLVGLLLSFRYWGRRGLLLNSFALLFWLAILGQTRSEARMWLPTAPLFAIWAALILDVLLERLSRRLPITEPRRKGVAILSLLVILPLLLNSVRISERFKREDVRTQTQRWIEHNIPPDTKIAVEYFSPNLDPAVWPVTREFHIYDKTIDWYQEQGIQYLVLSEAGNDPNKISLEERATRAALIERVCLVETFKGSFLSAETIHMWVYRVPPCEH